MEAKSSWRLTGIGAPCPAPPVFVVPLLVVELLPEVLVMLVLTDELDVLDEVEGPELLSPDHVQNSASGTGAMAMSLVRDVLPPRSGSIGYAPAYDTSGLPSMRSPPCWPPLMLPSWREKSRTNMS